MHRDAVLPTFRLSTGTALAAATPWHSQPVTLDSPALDVMTDLTKVEGGDHPTPTKTLRQAEQAMIYQGVRMLFVVTEMPRPRRPDHQHRPARRAADGRRPFRASCASTRCASPT